jgi:hypothetical protein
MSDNSSPKDPFTNWALTAIDIIRGIYSQEAVDERPIGDLMLMLVQALDQGDLDQVFGNSSFMKKTEALLLAMLRGDAVEVEDPQIFTARNEILAAAQVIYNQGVARGFWKLHPEISQAMDKNQ